MTEAAGNPPASAALLEFCRAGGVAARGVAAAAVARGGRGLVATAALRPGDPFLSVPRALLLSAESATRDAALCAALAAGAEQPPPPTLRLGAHLLAEAAKGGASFWAPYIGSLPRSYETAMCFTESDVEALQAPYAQARVRSAVASAAAAAAAARPALAALALAPKWRSRGAWLWAASTLSSRTMYVPGDAAGCLTPFGDMLNYGPPPPPVTPALFRRSAAAAAAGRASNELQPEGEWGDGGLDDAAGAYVLRARRHYNVGDEVLLVYGRHDNLGLLEHYGFVLPHHANPHDVALLGAELFPEAARGALSGAAATVHANGAPSWELLQALRLAGAAPAERRTKAHLALDGAPISASSERWALEALRGACRAALDALPTRADADAAELEAGALGGCARVAVEWRLTHKRIIEDCAAQCSLALLELA
jgi:hypothetical protein